MARLPLGSIVCALPLALATVTLLATASVRAQHDGEMIFVGDGGGPSFVHFSTMDAHRVRTPDFERSDLPIFNKTLRLSDDQRAVVEKRLIAYIEAFQALVTEHLPPPPKGQMISMQGGDGFAMEGVFGMPGGSGVLPDIDIDALGGEGEGMVAITVGAGVGVDPSMLEDGGEMDITIDAGAPDDGEPSANVMISFGGPDGEEISDELREQLEQQAMEMAEKFREQMQKNMEEGVDPLGGALSIEDRIDEHHRHMEEMSKRIAALKKDLAVLRDQFVEDVQRQLAEEQLDRWPVLERALTRKKTLPRGRLDGERTDLIALVDRLDLPDEQADAVREPLDAYEVVLHDALLQRNDYVDRAEERVNAALESGEHEKALSVVDHATKLRIGVRDVNWWYTTELAARLPEDVGEALRTEALQEAHPRIFRTTRGRKAFEAASRHADALPADVYASVLELDAAYTAELQRLNDELVRLTRRHQPSESRRAIEMMTRVHEGPMTIGMGGPDPVREAYGRRRALDARYINMLKDMLPPEVAADLPKPPKRRSGPMIIERSTFEAKSEQEATGRLGAVTGLRAMPLRRSNTWSR